MSNAIATGWIGSAPAAQTVSAIAAVAPMEQRHASYRDLQEWFASQVSSGESVREPMAQSSWVYSAIRVIAQTLAGLPCKITREGDTEPITGGPADQLLKRPGGGLTGNALLEQIAGHLVEGGEAHVVTLDNNGQPTAIPREWKQLIVVGRRQMQELRDPRDGSLAFWRYTPLRGSGFMTIFPEDEAYMRLFNPYDNVRGLSPLHAAALGISHDYRAAEYNNAALANGGSPGGFYSFPNQLTPDQRNEFKREALRRHGGTKNANRPGVLENGVTWQNAGFSNVDLDLHAGRKMTREEIFAVLGVPPVLGNVFESAHYNVADAAQEIFLYNTIWPLVEKIEAMLNLHIVDRLEPGHRLVIDVSQHHVIQRIEHGKLESLTKAINAFVPWNEAKNFLNLPFEDQPWGDTSIGPISLGRAEDIVEGIGATPPEIPLLDDTPPTDEADELVDADASAREDEAWHVASSAVARQEQALAQSVIPMIQRRFAAFFTKTLNRISANVRREYSSTRTAGLYEFHIAEDEAIRIAKRVLLDLADQTNILKAIVADYFPRTAELAVRAELTSMGFDSAQASRVIAGLKRGRIFSRILAQKQNAIAAIEPVTRRRVVATLTNGLRNGENVQELTGRVQNVLGGARARALRIARTEAGQAVSAGRYIAMTAARVKGKGWLHGANPRPTHSKAEATYHPRRGAIPMEQPFQVGNAQMMYPRDPAGTPEEIINCNCTLVPARLPQRDERAA